MKKLILSLAFLFSFAAQAAGTVTGTIVQATVSGAYVYYKSGGTVGVAQPSCASTNPKRFVIDPNTVAGQAFIKKLDFAAALGKSVFMQGTGTCSLDGAVETLSYIDVDTQ